MSFEKQEFPMDLLKSNRLFFLLSHAFGVSKKSLSKPMSQSFSPIFSRDCCPSLTDM